jgi:hypothetical protein
MSTAFYPQGMSTYNNRVAVPYSTWKANGVESYPVGITATNIRPLTNKDSGNNFPAAFGKARPIKHYRKGTTIPIPIILLHPENPNNIIEVTRNYQREVKSSSGTSLGGGAGGSGMITQMIYTPGSFIVKPNQPDEISETNQANYDCKTCKGASVVVDYKPNKSYLTENPEPETQIPRFCCNAEKKALRRVIPASTNLKKNYYTTHAQYMQNRCQTYEQRAFNFVRPKNQIDFLEQLPGNQFITKQAIKNAKPGSALATLNTYVANCQPNAEIYQASEINLISAMLQIMQNENIFTSEQISKIYDLNIMTLNGFANYLESLKGNTKAAALKVFIDFSNNPYTGIPFEGPNNPMGCKLVIYKPNNPQFAKQGAVSSSTRTLKLNVTTIEKNIAGYNRQQKIGTELGIAEATTKGGVPAIPFLYKNKAPYCTQDYFTNFHPQFQNPRTCSSLTTNSSVVNNPTTRINQGNSQSAFPSNHFQSSYASM